MTAASRPARPISPGRRSRWSTCRSWSASATSPRPPPACSRPPRSSATSRSRPTARPRPTSTTRSPSSTTTSPRAWTASCSPPTTRWRSRRCSRRRSDEGIHVVGYDANSQPDAREWFVNQAEFNGIGKAMIDAMVAEIGEDGSFGIVTSTFTTPNQARWIAEMWAYAAQCHPDLKWLETVEAQEDNILSFNQATTLINKYGDELDGLFGMTSVATPASAEAVTQAGPVRRDRGRRPRHAERDEALRRLGLRQVGRALEPGRSRLRRGPRDARGGRRQAPAGRRRSRPAASARCRSSTAARCCSARPSSTTRTTSTTSTSEPTAAPPRRRRAGSGAIRPWRPGAAIAAAPATAGGAVPGRHHAAA